MIDIILNTLGERISQTKIYSKVFCMAEMSEDGDGKRQPKAYVSNGQLKNVSDFDNANGVCYFRKNGKIEFSPFNDSESQRTACEEVLQLSIPLRFVGMIKKDTFTDDAFTDDRIALQITNALAQKHALMTTVISARSTAIEVQNYDTDSLQIIQEEYRGIERGDFPYTMSYIAVNFQAVVIILKDCFQHCVDVGTFVCINGQWQLTACTTTSKKVLFIDHTPAGGTYNTLIGAVDGINKIFQVSQGSYISGTLGNYVNGALVDSGTTWNELDPNTGTYEYAIAPFVGDILSSIYQKQ